MGLVTSFWDFLDKFRRVEQTPQRPRRGPVDHVIILDGTMSSLLPGKETNAGLTWKLLAETMPRADLSLRYEAGIQFSRWGDMRAVIEGRGINRQIRRAYGALASRYREGDRLFLFGYSRGAYAVRSLAGVIDTVGLLRHDLATERNVQHAYRHYSAGARPETLQAFRKHYCHADIKVEMIGVWDTVKALGLRAPLLWRWSETQHAFHSHHLGTNTLNGFHALALDETRVAYAPVLWTTREGYEGRCEQMWFRGTHGDIGGQIEGEASVRPLANIPLVWILDRAEECGLTLPEGWHDRFPQDPDAPSVGMNRGWGRLFVARRRRIVGRDPSEHLHETAHERQPITSLP